jgi:hypothetical protein
LSSAPCEAATNIQRPRHDEAMPAMSDEKATNRKIDHLLVPEYASTFSEGNAEDVTACIQMD